MYVIYLSSNIIDKPNQFDSDNVYGYWTGKDYIRQRCLIPYSVHKITDDVKVYSSKKRAENALKSCLNRNYAYVIDGEIREYH